MRVIKNIFSQIPVFVLWLLASALIWSWIFSLITDTSPDKKITVYCDVDQIRDVDLAVELERNKPEGIKMIKVHPFSYFMLDVENLSGGDLFILPESHIDEYAEFLAGGAQGRILLHAAGADSGGAAAFLTYGNEDYYLFLGAQSTHSEDGKACQVARRLLDLP